MHLSQISVQLVPMSLPSSPLLHGAARATRAGLRRTLTTALLSAAFLLFSPLALGKPKVHTVYEGQRLGSIAKRYNVTVEELCRANGISAKAPIKPGQQLVIPGTDDGASEKKKEAKSDKKDESSPEKSEKPTGKAKVHVVAKGHTLSAIAGRYAITVTALCGANGITKSTPLSVGTRLVIPHKSDKDGSYANKQRLAGDFDEKKSRQEDENDDKRDKKSSKKSDDKSWEKYVKPAWRRGYIKIRRYGRAWEGYVIGPNNEVLGHASNKINFVLGATEDGPHIDPKLIRLIASISDKFGGREMRIVSGYRTKSFVAASKHKQGKAFDFSIPGIPNEALRDYLRTIDGVGVGYYPNSSFLHLDVRGYNSYWIDHAGPGEAPRKKGSKKTAKSKDESTDKDEGPAGDGPDAEDGPDSEDGPASDDGPAANDDSAADDNPGPADDADK